MAATAPAELDDAAFATGTGVGAATSAVGSSVGVADGSGARVADGSRVGSGVSEGLSVLVGLRVGVAVGGTRVLVNLASCTGVKVGFAVLVTVGLKSSSTGRLLQPITPHITMAATRTTRNRANDLEKLTLE